MRIFITFLVVVLTYVFHTTVFGILSISGIIPNIPLIVVVSYALLRGKKEGAFVGWGMGMLFDILLGMHFGFYSALFAAVGYFIGRNQPEFYRENYILPALFCIFATAFYEFAHYAEHFLFQQGSSFIYFVFQILLPTVVYTGILTLPIYRLLFGLDEWLVSKERYRHRFYGSKTSR